MNEQEEFWAGKFGREYTARNRVDWKARAPFWRLMLNTAHPRSVLEVGCNAGWNLLALRDEDPSLKLRGVDLNVDALREACEHYFDCREVGASEVGTLWPGHFDLVFTAGVLIHVSPTALPGVLESIIAASRRYVLAVEYFSQNDEEIIYRGERNRLWKRNYGQKYRDLGLKLIAAGGLGPDSGFDHCLYWLFEKKPAK